MIVWLLSACRLVVDFPADPSARPTSPQTSPAPTQTPSSIPTSIPTGAPGRAEILGAGASDALGSGGLRWLEAGGETSLVVLTPSLQEVALFAADTLIETVPYGAASAQIAAPGAEHVAVAGRMLAIASPSRATVWWIDAGAQSGSISAPSVAGSAILGANGGDDDDDDSGDLQFGSAIAAADYDGDGLPELAVGDPSARGGDGLVFLFSASDGLGTTDLSLDDASEELRGAGGALGASIAMGTLDGTSRASLVACSPGITTCYLLAGGTEGDGEDIEDAATAQLQGILGVSALRIGDIDGDGENDLLTDGASGHLVAWLGPLAQGIHSESDATIIVSGLSAGDAVGAAGSLLVAAPDTSAGALFQIAPAQSAVLPGEASGVWRGQQPGDRFGAALSDLRPNARDFAVAAPGASGAAAGSGVVVILSLP